MAVHLICIRFSSKSARSRTHFHPTSPTAQRSEFPQQSARPCPGPPPLSGWNLCISRQQFRLFMGTLCPSGETDHPRQRSALSVRPRRHCSSPQRSQLVGLTLETGPDCLRAACQAAAFQWPIRPGHTQGRPSVFTQTWLWVGHARLKNLRPPRFGGLDHPQDRGVTPHNVSLLRSISRPAGPYAASSTPYTLTPEQGGSSPP